DGAPHPGERVAPHAATHAPDGDRPGRVGADALDLCPLPGEAIELCVAVASGKDGIDLLLQPAVSQPEVDKAPDALDAADVVGFGEMIDDGLRDVVRLHAGEARKLHCHRGGIVAVIGLARARDGWLRDVEFGQRTGFLCALDGLFYLPGKVSRYADHNSLLTWLEMRPQLYHGLRVCPLRRWLLV